MACRLTPKRDKTCQRYGCSFDYSLHCRLGDPNDAACTYRVDRVIVYSHMAADEVILTCLDLGAVTYLAKSEGRATIRRTGF